MSEEKKSGEKLFSVRGIADVVKDQIVYELKFVSELTHEHFLQCACYMVALNLDKGILWNTRNNTAFEICIPDQKKFLDAVANTITKNKIKAYFKPAERKSMTISAQINRPMQMPVSIPPTEIAKYSTGSKVRHSIFGYGEIVNLSKINGSSIVRIAFDNGSTRLLLLEKVLARKLLRIVSDEKSQRIGQRAQKKDPQQEQYENGYQDVKEAFTQQADIIRDRYGTRWVKCEKCGTIKQDVEFVSYGGRNHINLGLCRDCYRKKEGIN